MQGQEEPAIKNSDSYQLNKAKKFVNELAA